jgi:hypothetical protein
MHIEKYRDIAYAEYLKCNQLRNYNHVSIIALDNRVLSIGTNKRKTHPMAMKYGYRNCELHSELDALLKVPQYLRSEDLKLINFRFGPKGDMKLSKPCAKCLPWCINTFAEIYYSIPNGLVQLEY